MMDYDKDFYRRKQELMQNIYVLKKDITPQEKEAMKDIKSSVQQAWAIRAMPCVLFGYLQIAGIPRAPAKIPKLLKSLNFGSHMYAIVFGLCLGYGLTPRRKIIKEVLHKHNITTDHNLGKLIAMDEEEHSSSTVPLYNYQSAQKAYNTEMKKGQDSQVWSPLNQFQKTEETQEPDDGFEDFYAKKRGRKTNAYGDELD
ncbi:uncharacterized protein LOC133196211 [Saccostrea echinata]|uniref:uncharacterized protein LOC133196211 n=1 Tax=Saccostrea echinata TaxID=191078 RepID=UPI002A8115BB|nr:uncharacterized protein LOC133196211 [Saccostrea echinata]